MDIKGKGERRGAEKQASTAAGKREREREREREEKGVLETLEICDEVRFLFPFMVNRPFLEMFLALFSSIFMNSRTRSRVFL